jgi:hypothetical protein
MTSLNGIPAIKSPMTKARGSSAIWHWRSFRPANCFA